MNAEGILETLVAGLAWYAVFLLAAVCHEAAHAWAALRLGDATASRAGQVSLDPRPHVRREPIGTILVPWVSFLLSQSWMMGWASAPYDPEWAERHPRRAALMALAGPLANLVLFLLAAGAIRAGLWAGWFVTPELVTFSAVVTTPAGTDAVTFLLSIAFSLNLILLFFNLLPVPPLDGAAAVLLLLPKSSHAIWFHVLREPWLGWIGLLVAWTLFPRWFGPVHALALRILYPDLQFEPV